MHPGVFYDFYTIQGLEHICLLKNVHTHTLRWSCNMVKRAKGLPACQSWGSCVMIDWFHSPCPHHQSEREGTAFININLFFPLIYIHTLIHIHHWLHAEQIRELCVHFCGSSFESWQWLHNVVVYTFVQQAEDLWFDPRRRQIPLRLNQ